MRARLLLPVGTGIYWFAAAIRRTVWRGFAVFLTGRLFEAPPRGSIPGAFAAHFYPT